MTTEWALFTKHTEDPKLAWLESRLDEAGIPHRRNGESFHAPILEVPAEHLDKAWEILASVDDMNDDDPMFGGTSLAADYDRLVETYRDRILSVMQGLCAPFLHAGWRVDGDGAHESLDDEASWCFLAVPDGGEDEDGYDVSIKIAFSEDYDGSSGGMNFVLDVVTWGGEIVGGLTPYNYSEDCWVKRSDAAAVEARFNLFRGAIDAQDVSELVFDHFNWEN